MAIWPAAVGIQVNESRHSGELREQPAAELFSGQLGTKTAAVSGLSPNDAAAKIAKMIGNEA